MPSYRGATFLDPKGRGAATGYDTAVALPAAGDDGEPWRGGRGWAPCGLATCCWQLFCSASPGTAVLRPWALSPLG